MSKKQVHAVVDSLLATAAESALHDTVHHRSYAQGLYHAAKRIVDSFDYDAGMQWPWFSEWRDQLIAAVSK